MEAGGRRDSPQGCVSWTHKQGLEDKEAVRGPSQPEGLTEPEGREGVMEGSPPPQPLLPGKRAGTRGHPARSHHTLPASAGKSGLCHRPPRLPKAPTGSEPHGAGAADKGSRGSSRASRLLLGGLAPPSRRAGECLGSRTGVPGAHRGPHRQESKPGAG